VIKGKSGGSIGRLSISKSELHTEMKLREKPESVEFNPLDALLCEVDVKKR
jgi:hypothetical protein